MKRFTKYIPGGGVEGPSITTHAETPVVNTIHIFESCFHLGGGEGRGGNCLGSDVVAADSSTREIVTTFRLYRIDTFT